ncbi:hypothetical protein QYM36_003208 [Artemia franciscana]|uniref:Uncharacterized protein n=1 Tax=Artemia franciscana TaxID=6661 RepID=A0AA88L921_ARTSF|nr:hypothetical protein QYM36_003208 [Artemia franciscana]
MEKLQKTVGFLESPKKIRKTDFSLCFVCQDEKKENLSIIKSSKKLLETLETSADPKFRRLLTEASKDSFLFKSRKWHSSCHRQLMYTIRKGTSAPEGCSSTENVSTTRKKTRSEPAAISFSYKTCCLFCSKTGSSKKNSLKLSNVETFSCSEAIVLKANLLWLTLPVVFSRVSGTDLIAAEAKYHKKCIDKFMATKPKCDVVHDVNKTIFALFLEGVESRLKEGRIYHISDFKEKLRKVLIDNGLVWQKHRLLWLKRSLDRHFGSQLIKFVDPRKGTFYHLKGTVLAGDMAAQVKAMIEEFEYRAVLMDSDDAGSDSSDSTVIDSDVAATSKSVTSSDEELGDCSFIDVGNDDGEGENGTRPRRSSVVSESGNSGPSRLSDKYKMEERKNFFYLMTKAKAQLVDSAKDFKESKSSIDLTYDAADSLVPPLLYNIIAFLIGDVSDPPVDSDTKYSLDEQTREKVLNLAQDIMEETALRQD